MSIALSRLSPSPYLRPTSESSTAAEGTGVAHRFSFDDTTAAAASLRDHSSSTQLSPLATGAVTAVPQPPAMMTSPMSPAVEDGSWDFFVVADVMHSLSVIALHPADDTLTLMTRDVNRRRIMDVLPLSTRLVLATDEAMNLLLFEYRGDTTQPHPRTVLREPLGMKMRLVAGLHLGDRVSALRHGSLAGASSDMSLLTAVAPQPAAEDAGAIHPSPILLGTVSGAILAAAPLDRAVADFLSLVAATVEWVVPDATRVRVAPGPLWRGRRTEATLSAFSFHRMHALDHQPFEARVADESAHAVARGLFIEGDVLRRFVGGPAAIHAGGALTKSQRGRVMRRLRASIATATLEWQEQRNRGRSEQQTEAAAEDAAARPADSASGDKKKVDGEGFIGDDERFAMMVQIAGGHDPDPEGTSKLRVPLPLAIADALLQLAGPSSIRATADHSTRDAAEDEHAMMSTVAAATTAVRSPAVTDTASVAVDDSVFEDAPAYGASAGGGGGADGKQQQRAYKQVPLQCLTETALRTLLSNLCRALAPPRQES
jgi:hypothetical protein